MRDKSDTDQEMLEEISALRRRVKELEQAEAERLRAERALYESEQKFKDLSEKSVAGIYLIQDGVFRYVNARLSEISGYEIEEMIGKLEVKDTIFPEDWPLVEENMRKRTAGEMGSLSYECRVVTKGKEVKTAEVHGSHTMYQGRPAIIGTCLDVTDRKRMEETLRESEAQIRSITDAALNAIIMMDPKGAISFWNPKAEEILGYSLDEAIGRNLHDLLAPGCYLEAHRSAFPDFVRTGRGNAIGRTLELAALRKDGTEVPVELSLSMVWRGGEAYAVGILRDITQDRQAEEEKKHSERLSVALEMAGAICHELNQPLQVIAGRIDLLSMGSKDDRTLRALEAMGDQVLRMGTITRKLMGLRKYSNRDYVGVLKITDIDGTPEGDDR